MDGVLKKFLKCHGGVVANAVRADLSKAGFVTNEDKSVWIPCQRLDWLGFTWDSARGTLQLSIGGLSRSLIPLTVLLLLILFFLPEDWPLLQGRSFLRRLFPGTFLGS